MLRRMDISDSPPHSNTVDLDGASPMFGGLRIDYYQTSINYEIEVDPSDTILRFTSTRAQHETSV
jgi:hypothetical protein